MAKNNFIFLRHNNSSVKTISDFAEKEGVYGMKVEDFFSLNKELIFSQMTASDKTAFMNSKGLSNWPTVSQLTIDMTLPCPCNLKIDPKKVTTELAVSQTNFQIDQEKFVAFAHDEIQKILQNEGYMASGLNKRNPTCQVFGWFKSLYYVGKQDKSLIFLRKENDVSEFADLSKYITNLNTKSSFDGASFTLSLPIINTSSKGNYISVLSNDKEVKNFRRAAKDDGSKSRSLFSNGKEFYQKTPLSQVEANYFSWLISPQDLLFISFEQLDLEKIRKTLATDSDNFSIETKIAGQVFDMIALVDSVKVVTDDVNCTANVEVTGRDLMKLLIEDGSFFFNIATTNSSNTVFANEVQGDVKDINFINGQQNNPLFRMRLDSTEIDIFRNRIKQSIEYVLKGVVSQLSNIEVVPNYVLDSYGDKRTKFIDLKPNK